MSAATGPTAAVDTPVAATVPRRAWAVLAISAAGVFVVFLDATVVNLAFPALSADFPGTSRAGLSWVLNAYAVVFGALLSTTGRLADDRGRKRVFLSGLVVFGIGSALCALAPSVGLLVAFRAAQAVGSALLVPASLALLLPEFPASRRAGAVGLWGAAGAVAAAVGPTLGALLVEGPGWRWVFWINLPLCAIAVLVGRRLLRESTGIGRTGSAGSPRRAARDRGLRPAVPRPGPGWRVGLGLRAGRGRPRPRPRARARPSGPGAASPQPRAARAPVRRTPLQRRDARAAALRRGLLRGHSVQRALPDRGVALLGAPHGGRPAAQPAARCRAVPPHGRLADRLGFRVLVVPGALSMTAGVLWLATQTGTDPAYLTHFLPGSILIGIAIGFALPTLGAAGAHVLEPHQFGAGSAVGATARQLGAVLGVAVLVAVLGTPGPSEALEAFHRSWAVIAAAAAACAVVSLGLAGRPAPPA